MPSKTEAQQVFDTVLSLEYNECVELEFPLINAAESFRSALYRERKNWAASTGSRDQISITRNYSNFPFKLKISKVPGMMTALIKRNDGSVTAMDMQEKEEKPVIVLAEPITEIERQKNLMRADGMGEDEINAYFQEDTE